MRIVLALAASLILSNLAAAVSIEDDVQRYIQIFSGEKKLHSDLGSSKNDEYVALLQEVAEKATAQAVVTHANEALGKYYGIRNR